MEKEIIELPPMCFFDCENFQYKKGAEELYRCKAVCMKTNDIFEMWDECPYLEKKYLIREYGDEGETGESETASD